MRIPLIATWLITLLFVENAFAQEALRKVRFLNDRVEIHVPKDLTAMTDEMWSMKYRRARPTLALSDTNARVNLIADLTASAATEDQIRMFKALHLAQLQKSRPDMELLGQGVKVVDGRKIGYIKFLSQAVDQKVFNYMFFTVHKGKLLLFTFNCIQSLQKNWEKTADYIVTSVKQL